MYTIMLFPYSLGVGPPLGTIYTSTVNAGISSAPARQFPRICIHDSSTYHVHCVLGGPQTQVHTTPLIEIAKEVRFTKSILSISSRKTRAVFRTSSKLHTIYPLKMKQKNVSTLEISPDEDRKMKVPRSVFHHGTAVLVIFGVLRDTVLLYNITWRISCRVYCQSHDAMDSKNFVRGVQGLGFIAQDVHIVEVYISLLLLCAS